jgi:hypothetical protein
MGGITDVDGNTKIHVEESPDEDIIRFDVGGTEYFRIDSALLVANGNIEVHANSSDAHLLIFSHDMAGENIKTTIGYHDLPDNTFSIIQEYPDDMQFYTDSVRRMTISAQGNIGIGTEAPDPSASLEISSSSSGILIPRMSTDQRDAIATPAAGLLVYNTNTSSFWWHTGGDSGDWIEISNGLIKTIQDADADTKIQVEESGDEDIIRFDIKGTEVAYLDSALLHVDGRVSIGSGTPHSTFQLNGSFASNVTTTNSNLLLNADHLVVLVSDPGFGNPPPTVSLPLASSVPGRSYTIKKTGSENPIIAPSGGNTIDGGGSYTLTDPNAFATIISNGSDWWIIARN